MTLGEATPDPEEVERLVGVLTCALQEFGSFRSDEGMAAVLTFAFRFAQSMLALEGKASKQHIADIMSRGFARTGKMIEWHALEAMKQPVH